MNMYNSTCNKQEKYTPRTTFSCNNSPIHVFSSQNTQEIVAQPRLNQNRAEIFRGSSITLDVETLFNRVHLLTPEQKARGGGGGLCLGRQSAGPHLENITCVGAVKPDSPRFAYHIFVPFPTSRRRVNTTFAANSMGRA